MKRALGVSLLLAACAGLPACGMADRMRQVAQTVRQTDSQLKARHEAFSRAVSSDQARRAAQEVNRPWLAGRAMPLAREVTLPPALRANVSTTFLFPGSALDLTEVGQRISAVTGIPVHVRPDALLPLARFLPRLAGLTDAIQQSAQPVTMHLTGGPEPLARILDRVSARFGVMWRYADGRIEFFRTETRVFNVRALTLNADADASLGLRAGGTDKGFTSSSQTTLSSGKRELLDVIKARLEPFLSRSGVLVAESGASSSVVVTDTPEVLRNIALYLERENRALTRRVRLVFEELTLMTRESAEIGVDWNLVFSSARVAASATTAGAAIAEAASLAVGLNEGPFAGSDAIVKALGQVGQIVRRSSVPVLTLNRRPITHAVRTTFSYIDKVETTALASGTGLALPSVSVSQKEETVGSLLTLVPDAQDDGQVLLSVAYDNTVAQPLKTVTFGDRSNPLQLQQVTIDGNGTVQQVVLSPGQPVVISGFDRTQEESDGRRLNPGTPLVLGGADRASSQHLMTVIVVTAQVEEGF